MSRTKNGSKMAAWELEYRLDDDDERRYLSKETINRREDQKLLDRITAAMHRLELENVKPSYDVKIRAGLHRGPYKSKRSRRSQLDDQSSTVPTSDRQSREPPQSNGFSRASSVMSDFGGDINYELEPINKYSTSGQPLTAVDALLLSSSRAWRGEDNWRPRGDDYGLRKYEDPYYQATVDRYSSLPRRWMRQLEVIDNEARRKSAVTAALQRPVERQQGASTEYDELMTYLKEPAAASRQRFFDDETTLGDRNDDEELEQLFDRPFTRRAPSNRLDWQVNEPNDYYVLSRSDDL